MRFRQVHLDFHTSEKIPNIGSKFNKKEFQQALLTGHVDSITVFSKCHHGYAYHPSMSNEIHPGLTFDLLQAQIEAAHEINVKTPVYLSAGNDERIARMHPEWRYEDKTHVFDNFSEPGYHQLCMNTPYLDILLAQIKEVAENYDADGIFLDIVGVRMCCCSSCIRSMLESGLDPDKDEDILANGEKVYANYLKRVRETIDSVKPGLPLYHNSGHTRQGRSDLTYGETHLELESLPTGGWGYDHFPISAKYVQNLGFEYLGMTGKFHTTWGEFGGYKHPNALRYEVALSAAMGAKCSVGDQCAPDGHLDMTTYELIGEAYSELEQKEEWLDHVTPICDVAVLTVESSVNEAGWQGTNRYLPDVGAGRILLEGKYLFSMIDSSMDFDSYKVIILPDQVILKEKTVERLKAFIKNGGKLLASGISPLQDCQGRKEFIFDFGVKWLGESEFNPSYARPLENNPYKTDYIMYSACQKLEVTDGQELVQMTEPYFNRTAKHFCSHQHAPSSGVYGGAGMVQGQDGIYIAWQIFEDYATKGEWMTKHLVCMALDRLLGEKKTLKTDLGSIGVVNLMKQNEKSRYVAHMLYAATARRGENIDAIEDICLIYDKKLMVKLPEKVKSVYLAPQKEELPFAEKDEYICVEVKKIDCHQMIVFEV